MSINADDLNKIIETVKKFLHDLIKPEMTIDTIAEVASPKLDEIIEKNAEKGLKYSAGKFKIEYLDEKHFVLEFEMYFKDEAGKWYKAANRSEPREAELIEANSWQTLKKRKYIEFPIGSPNVEEIEQKVSKDEDYASKAPETSDEITLETLMSAKKS